MEPSASDEVAQLRARIHDLEQQLQQTEPSGSGGDRTRSPRGALAAVSAVFLILACVLAPFAVVAVWAQTQISDTDEYVRTMAPLAEDPAVRTDVAAEVTATVLASVQVDQVTQDLLTSLAGQPNVPPRVAAALPALAGPITTGVENFTRTEVTKILASDEFVKLWGQMNRRAHDQVVRLLAGDPNGAVTAQGDTVTLNLGPIIAHVKQELVNRGFTLAENIPDVDRSILLVQSPAVTKAQSAYRLLNTLGTWLPLLVVGLFVVGVVTAADRRRALLRGALGIVATMLLAGVALAVFRSTYVQSTPAGVLSATAAGNVFDTLVRFLRTGIRAVAVLGLVLALIAYLSGPSSAANGTRSFLSHGIERLRGRAVQAGWRTGGFGVWVHARKQLLRAAILMLGGLVLLFWTRPTASVVIGVAAIVVLLLLVLEFLAEAAAPSSPTEGLPEPASSSIE